MSWLSEGKRLQRLRQDTIYVKYHSLSKISKSRWLFIEILSSEIYYSLKIYRFALVISGSLLNLLIQDREEKPCVELLIISLPRFFKVVFS